MRHAHQYLGEVFICFPNSIHVRDINNNIFLTVHVALETDMKRSIIVELTHLFEMQQ